MNVINVYIAPQGVSIPKALLGNTFSIVFAFCIAFFYGVIIAISPLIYINFFVTVGFGFILGLGVRFATRLFKVTHKPTAMSMAATSGILGLYFSWIAYVLYFVVEGSVVNAYIDAYLILDPAYLIGVILDMNQHGVWEIFGIPFKGWILTLIWLFEAGIILALTLLLVKNQTLSPFSIKLNKWYKRLILEKDFKSIGMKEEFKESLAVDCIKAIDSLESGKAFHFARVSVYYLKNEDQQYLMVENVQKDRRGKSENAVEVIPLVAVSTEDANTLIEKYHGATQSFFDY